MIEDKDLAAEVNEKLLSAHRSIVDALKLVEEHGSELELRAFRAGAVNVAGHLFGLLLRPLWQARPELAPEGLDMSPPLKKKGKR
ncbi:hypothetical protein [Paraburkholderia fungorum]|uniref:Uncharacterized protein n=1 Tax=Paraburkholderia fungorum TaxID=134537 RepID=A0A420F9W9_9BURK|nr:hypothetical protein [Paraburkholderia fungorum]RKF29758.1 hypothetical protein BCY88_14105 [Paraburkholderia fungorum]